MWSACYGAEVAEESAESSFHVKVSLVTSDNMFALCARVSVFVKA